MIMKRAPFLAATYLLLVQAFAVETSVDTRQALTQTLTKAQPGDTIRIAPGTYAGGLRFESLHGTAQDPIVITAVDPENPPTFEGGHSAFQFSQCAHLVLRHVRIRHATANGLNIDDGGRPDTRTHHITLEDLAILETGPKGNRDGIKLSGLDHFTVRRCTIHGWGGSAIDLVGCHHGVIEQCTFEGKEGFSQSNAVQMKGGSSDLQVLRNTFRDVGHRSINIGGHTGRPYFRPQVDDYEATRIEIAGNTFHGSMSPIVWATAKGGHVHHNTILYPEKWVLRILQENAEEGFAPSQGGQFENNVIVCDARVVIPVNIGGGTAPSTFTFQNNYWRTQHRRLPDLPTEDRRGQHEQADGDVDLEALLAAQQARGRGAAAYTLPSAPLFKCDFESPQWYQDWDLDAPPRNTDTVEDDPDRGFTARDGKALRIRVQEGGHYGTSLQYRFAKQLGEEPEAIMFQYDLRFGRDWKPERGGKLPGIAGTYDKAGWGGRPADGTNGWSARGLFEGMQDGRTPIGYYCYHADMKGKYGSHWRWETEGEDRGQLANERWYRITQYAKMNTPGKNDGILQGWVDGQLAFDRRDVRMRDTDQLKIETIWLNVYYGGSWQAASDYHLYIDNVLISREHPEASPHFR